MKAFWKVLGFAALAAGLAPYKIEKNEETGESSYQALLWRGISKIEDGERKIDIDMNEGTLTSRIKAAVEKKSEAHLFSDELSVEYHAPEAEEAAEAVEEAVEETAASVEEAVEDAAEVVEEAAEAVEAEEPKSEE